MRRLTRQTHRKWARLGPYTIKHISLLGPFKIYLVKVLISCLGHRWALFICTVGRNWRGSGPDPMFYVYTGCGPVTGISLPGQIGLYP